MPAPNPGSRSTVLVVDPDAGARRILEMGLRQTWHFTIESAGSAAAANEILASKVVHAVVAEIALGDQSGLQFCRELRREDAFADVPLLFLSSDDRVATKVAAFEAGARDYVVKPYVMPELVARLAAALAGAESARRLRLRVLSDLAGDLACTSFTDVVGLLHAGRRTGRLTIATPSGTGVVLFSGGKVLHATFAGLLGPDAFFRSMTQHEGRFEFRPIAIDRNRIPITIALAPTALMMEGARRADMLAKGHRDAIPEPAGAVTVAGGVGPQTPTDAVRPDAAAAARLRDRLADPNARGTLSVVLREELRAWTAPDPGQPRCHVVLVADLSSGVAAMRALAEPLGGREIEAALAIDQKVLALTFAAGDGARLDVMLLDQEVPAFVLVELQLRPAAMILAPRDGEWRTLGAVATAELETLLGWLRPHAVIAAGDDSVTTGARAMADRLAPGCPLETIAQQGGISGEGLRAVLAAATKAAELTAAARP
jgi:DNA-binding response OmpR family regulator